MLRNQILHPTVVMRRSALIEVGGYPESPRVEDYLLWLRLMARGVVAHVGVDWVYYRRASRAGITQSVPTLAVRRVGVERRQLAASRGWSRAGARLSHRVWALAQSPHVEPPRRGLVEGGRA